MWQTKSELLGALKARAEGLGFAVHEEGADGLSAEKSSILAKWILGSRSVKCRMSCRLDDAARTVHYREAIVESSWGLPPPTLTVEVTKIKGWQLSGSRTDRSIGGGGEIDYAQARESLRSLVETAGWQFHFEGGRMP